MIPTIQADWAGGRAEAIANGCFINKPGTFWHHSGAPSPSPQLQCQQEAVPTGGAELRLQALEFICSPCHRSSKVPFLVWIFCACLNTRLYKNQGKLPQGPLWPQQGCFQRWTNWLVLIPSSPLPISSPRGLEGEAKLVVVQGW